MSKHSVYIVDASIDVSREGALDAAFQFQNEIAERSFASGCGFDQRDVQWAFVSPAAAQAFKIRLAFALRSAGLAGRIRRYVELWDDDEVARLAHDEGQAR